MHKQFKKFGFFGFSSIQGKFADLEEHSDKFRTTSSKDKRLKYLYKKEQYENATLLEKQKNSLKHNRKIRNSSQDGKERRNKPISDVKTKHAKSPNKDETTRRRRNHHSQPTKGKSSSETELIFISPEEINKHRRNEKRKSESEKEKINKKSHKHKSLDNDKKGKTSNDNNNLTNLIIKDHKYRTSPGRNSSDNHQFLMKKEIFKLIGKNTPMGNSSNVNTLKKYFSLDHEATHKADKRKESRNSRKDSDATFFLSMRTLPDAISRRRDHSLPKTKNSLDQKNPKFTYHAHKIIHKADNFKSSEETSDDKKDGNKLDMFFPRHHHRHKSNNKKSLISDDFNKTSSSEGKKVNLKGSDVEVSKKKRRRSRALNIEDESLIHVESKSSRRKLNADDRKSRSEVKKRHKKRSKIFDEKPTTTNSEESGRTIKLNSTDTRLPNPLRHKHCLVKKMHSVIEIPPSEVNHNDIFLEKKKNSAVFKKYYNYNAISNENKEFDHAFSDSNKVYSCTSDHTLDSLKVSPRKLHGDDEVILRRTPTTHENKINTLPGRILKTVTHISTVVLDSPKGLRDNSKDKNKLTKSRIPVYNSKLEQDSPKSGTLRNILRKSLNKFSDILERQNSKLSDSSHISRKSRRDSLYSATSSKPNKLSSRNESFSSSPASRKSIDIELSSRHHEYRSRDRSSGRASRDSSVLSRISKRSKSDTKVNDKKYKKHYGLLKEDTKVSEQSSISKRSTMSKVYSMQEKDQSSRASRDSSVFSRISKRPKSDTKLTDKRYKKNYASPKEDTKTCDSKKAYSMQERTQSPRASRDSSVLSKKNYSSFKEDNKINDKSSASKRNTLPKVYSLQDKNKKKSKERLSPTRNVQFGDKKKTLGTNNKLESKSEIKIKDNQRKTRTFERSSTKGSLSYSNSHSYSQDPLDGQKNVTTMLLTKNYKDEEKLSRWQKRKMYADLVRKNLIGKNRNVKNMPAQVLEVRFLTVEAEQNMPNAGDVDFKKSYTITTKDSKNEKKKKVNKKIQSSKKQNNDYSQTVENDNETKEVVKKSKNKLRKSKKEKSFIQSEVELCSVILNDNLVDSLENKETSAMAEVEFCKTDTAKSPLIGKIPNDKFDELFEKFDDDNLSDILKENYNFLKKDFNIAIPKLTDLDDQDDESTSIKDGKNVDSAEWLDFVIDDSDEISYSASLNEIYKNKKCRHPSDPYSFPSLNKRKQKAGLRSAPGSEESGYSTVKSLEETDNFFMLPGIRALLHPTSSGVFSYRYQPEELPVTENSSICTLDLCPNVCKSLQTSVHCAQKSVQISTENIPELELFAEMEKEISKVTPRCVEEQLTIKREDQISLSSVAKLPENHLIANVKSAELPSGGGDYINKKKRGCWLKRLFSRRKRLPNCVKENKV